MNRISKKFTELDQAKRKALIPYVTPEFPFAGSTEGTLRRLERSGADMIEVGIPFSDPLADGGTIQHSSQVALQNGVTIPKILEAVRAFRAGSQLPILLMGYINPILRYGVKNFLRDCAQSGVDGLIVPDLPPEESETVRIESLTYAISNVFLIAPTSSDERIRLIDGLSTDFSYCVSVTGVTGARQQLGLDGSLDQFLSRVRANVKKRFVVGFGISSHEQVQRVWQFADGAVVGSALVNAMSVAKSPSEAIDAAGKFLSSLRSTA